jgi:8-hydroxy-5-deazaflavin:NADPH oxidoreductase
VLSLIEEIGFAPLDTGSLAEGGRRQQPGSPVYVKKLRRADARARLGAPR